MVTYLPNEVEIVSTQKTVFQTLAGIPGLTYNDIQTARMLDSALTGPAANSPLSRQFYQATLGQLINDVEAADPGSLAVLSSIGASLDNTTFITVAQRLEDIATPMSPQAGGPAGPDAKGGKEVMPPPANRWGTFITGSGDFQHVEDTSASRGYNFADGGFTLGVDYRFTDHFVAGIFGSYANTGIDISNGRVNVNAGKGGLYATYFDGGFYVNSALEGGYSSYDNHRDGLGGTARSNTRRGRFQRPLRAGLQLDAARPYLWTHHPIPIHIPGHGRLYRVGLPRPSERPPPSIPNPSSAESGSKPPIIGRSERPLSGRNSAWNGSTSTATPPRASMPGWPAAPGTPSASPLQVLAGTTFTSAPASRWSSAICLTAYAYFDGQYFRTNYDSSTVTGGLRLSF